MEFVLRSLGYPLIRRAMSLPLICAAFVLFALALPGARAATLTVNTTADSSDAAGSCASAGTCSLRDAISQAASGDTITFSVTGTIPLNSGLPQIDQNLIIQGPGANRLTISGANAYQIFVIGDTGSPTVQLSGLTIANGNAGSGFGGAISIGNGTMSVNGCTLSGNSAHQGGAINNGNGALTISNSSFLNNSSTGQGGAITSGTGSTSIGGSTLSGNSAGGFGGAVWIGFGSIVNSTFTGNSASADGGAIFVATSVSVTNNTFYGNSAGGGGGAISDGGSGASLTANNNLFTGNTANSAGAGIYIPSGTGRTESASNNVYYNNLRGGSEDDCNGCTSSGTPGDANGNVEAGSNPLTLPLANYGGTTQTLLPQPGSAAICAGSANLASNAGLFADQRGFFMAPAWSQCASGAIDSGAAQTNYVEVEKTGDAGSGSSDCSQTPNTPNPNCTLRDAVAVANENGGADIDFGASVFGVNLNSVRGTLELFSAVNIIGSSSNLVTVNGNGSSTNPLSVFTVDPLATAAFYGLTITGGYALSSSGGGIQSSAGTVSVLSSSISGNFATSAGGIYSSGLLIVADSTIAGNTGQFGGGIQIDTGGTASVTESTVYGNSDGTSGAGGAIYNDGTLVVTASTIAGNSDIDSSFCGGGGIYNPGALTLANSIVAGNSSVIAGCANLLGVYTDAGGNVLGGTGATGSDPDLVGGTGNQISLSGLQYNGVNAGIQTLIPTPGSPAICAGLASNIPSGTTTDERGYPLQPTGAYCASGTLDSGAVQTNYTSVQFVQQPSDAAVNADINPAPTVEVLETDTLLSSNNTDAVGGISVILNSSGGTFGGRLAVTSSSSPSLATFSSLFSSTAASGITLSTSPLSITGSYSLPAATSNAFNVYGSTTQLVVSAPATATVGTPFTVTVTAEDALGSTVVNDNDTVHLTLTGQPALLGTVTLSNGTGSANVTLSVPGTVTLTGTDSTTSLSGQSGSIVVATTLVVNTLADSSDASGSCGSGTCSLRDAINQATLDDTITFSVTGTITLTSALPTIVQSLTIQGPGANQLTISGNKLYRIFTVNPGTVSISGLTLADGSAGMGGGIYDHNGATTLTVSNCTFSGNSANNGNGGAIFIFDGTLSVSNSTFSGNSVNGSPGGGAIFSQSGTLTVSNSTFSGNSAINGDGGGIYFLGKTTPLTVTNSTFSGNSASGTSASQGEGGGINLSGIGTVSNSTFSGNSAAFAGGGIMGKNNLTANNSIFSGNSAPAGAGIGNSSGQNANASYNVYFNNLAGGSEDDCNACTSNTNAVSAGSNPLAITLGLYGGPTQTLLPQTGSAAICAGSSSLAVDANSTPLTTDQRGFPLNASCVDAGAVQTNYIMVTKLTDDNDGFCNTSSCSLRDAVITANNNGYGDIAFQSSLTSVATPGTITLTSALPDITGVGVNIVGPGANQLTVNANSPSNASSYRVFTVDSGATALFYGITITGGVGPDTVLDSIYGLGGDIANQGTLTIEESAITGGKAGDGGGFANVGTSVILDSTISGNLASAAGSGIFNAGALEITETTIFGNFFGLSAGGGAVFNDTGAVTITNSTIAGNAANSDGDGGVAGNVGSVTLRNTIVAGNTDTAYVDPTSVSNIQGHYTDLGGNIIGGNTNATTSLVNGTGAAITLSPLQYNGTGATLKTMIPLPGSAAICAGETSVALDQNNLALTTDERGYPLQPTGGYCSSGNIDAGAVQTNYTSLAFVQQPADVAATLAMSPAPTLRVTETDTLLSSGNTDAVNVTGFVLPSSSFTLTDSSNELENGYTGSTPGGLIELDGLTFSGGDTTDMLTAEWVVTGSTTLSATSGNFNVTGAAPHLVVSLPPTVMAGQSFSVTVTAKDSAGHVAAGYKGTVHFTTSDSSLSIVLPSNYTFTAGDAGVHTFPSAAKLDKAGTQTITATDTATGTITGFGSTSVSPGIETQLVFSQQPSATATAGVAFATQPTVSLEDQFGNVVTSDSTNTVTVSRGSQGTAPLQGAALTVTVANGVATFSGLAYNRAETMNLLATSTAGGVSSATSNSIVVSAAAPASITASGGSGQSAYVNTAFSTALLATVTDAFGNLVPGATVTFTAPGSGASGSFSNSSTTIPVNTNSSGQASETFTANNSTGSYAVTAATSGVTPDASFSLTNNPTPVYVVTVTTDDSFGVPGNCVNQNTGLSSTGSSNNTNCALRDAVSAADAAGTGNITFDSTVFSSSQTIYPLNAIYSNAGDSINPLASISITGPAGGVTLDGTNFTNITGSGLLHFGMGRTVSLSGLTLQNSPGPALSIYENANATIASCTFRANHVGIDAEDPGNDGLVPSVTVTNSTFANNANDPSNGQGGGIFVNPGIVSVTGSTLSGNSAAQGGAAYIGAGTLAFTNSTINGNTASSGGGIYIDQPGGIATLAVNDTSFTGNQATNGGGGGLFVNQGSATIQYSTFSGNSSIANGGAINSGGTVTLTNVTVSGNSSNTFAGGIDNEGLSFTLSNTIVAGNTSGANPDGIGGFTSGGHNLIGDATGMTGLANGANGDQVGIAPNTIDPQLTAIGNFGGPTQTMVPILGSPAICNGSASLIPNSVTADQRGLPNASTTYPGLANPCVDIGAVETQGYTISLSTLPSSLTTGLVISPAPVVTVTANNLVEPLGSGPIKMTDAQSQLTGTLTKTMSGGQATFSDLVIGANQASDTLTATASLNGSKNITATSGSFSVSQATPTVNVTDAGGTFNGSTYPATCTVTGLSGVPGTSLDGVTPTLAYYAGTTATGTPLSGPPSDAGTYTAQCSYAGSTSYSPASNTVTFNISASTPFLTWTPPSTVIYGAALSSYLNATASCGLSCGGSFSYSAVPLGGGSTIPVTSPTSLAPGTYTITAQFPGSADYTAVSTQQQITVSGQSVWIVNSAASTSELAGNGFPLTSTPYSGGNTAAAIDATGNVWAVGPVLVEISQVGSTKNRIDAGGGIISPIAIAIDGNSQIWVVNGNHTVSLFSSSGAPLSPATGFTDASLSTPSAIAIDLGGSVWIANQGNNSVTRLLGLAAPAAPLSTAAKNNTTGAKP